MVVIVGTPIVPLKRRPTYEELINEIEEGTDKIIYPDRGAKFLRNSFELSFLDEVGQKALNEQQEKLYEHQMIQKIISDLAVKNGTSFSHEKIKNTEVFDIASSNNSRENSQLPFNRTVSEQLREDLKKIEPDEPVEEKVSNVKDIVERFEAGKPSSSGLTQEERQMGPIATTPQQTTKKDSLLREAKKDLSMAEQHQGTVLPDDESVKAAKSLVTSITARALEREEYRKARANAKAVAAEAIARARAMAVAAEAKAKAKTEPKAKAKAKAKSKAESK